MPEAQIPSDENSARRRIWPERTRMRLLFGLVIMLVGFIIFAWVTREQIARDIISDELAAYEIPANYSIRSIGPAEQVLTNVVLGDADKPDFTADQVIVKLSYGWGTPEIGQITLVNPRLYGSYRGGEISFGTLDKALFAPSEEPPTLPNFGLDLSDGRVLIETDFGDVGIKAEGSGNLANGFVGTLAASAPDMIFEDCKARKISAFGELSSDAGLLSFNGPVRARGLRCSERDVAADVADWQLSLTSAADFNGFDASGPFAATRLSGAGASAARSSGTAELSWSDQGLRSRFDVKAEEVRHAMASISELALEGGLRADASFEGLTADVNVDARDAAFPSLTRSGAFGSSSSGDLPAIGPLIAKLERSMARLEQGNSVQATLNLRQNGEATTATVPQGLWRGADGSTLASLSRLQVQVGAESAVPLMSGNVVVSGQGLPQIRVRMEQDGLMRVRMDPFASGDSSLAIPDLTLRQSPDGALRFNGSALVSGELADDGAVEALSIPLDGSWSEAGGLALLTRCASLRAQRVTYTSLTLERPQWEVCPKGQSAGLRQRGDSVILALSGKPASLSGTFGEEPLQITSGALAYSSRDGLQVKDFTMTMGQGEDQSRFAIASLTSEPSDVLRGTLSGAELTLAVVPLDVTQGRGQWSFADGALLFEGAAFRVSDRDDDPRFEPLISRDGTAQFVDGTLSADATLREPNSFREVTRVFLNHEFASGEGQARLVVDEVLFDEALQPAAGSDVCLNRDTNPPDFRPATPGLTCLALGVVANVEGTVSGEGRIDWDAQDVTSSGSFAAQNANLAAAFGPLEGVSGTIEFTDLLDLTTAPGQLVTIRAVNPGVEVFDGAVRYNLREGQILELEGGRWPFMGGELALEPAVLDFREPMDRRYVLLIEGLDAARFVSYMELGNISATGVFDGAVPIVFDTDGNGRIEQGLLTSRAPGGNVSYVGELTYEDLGAMANFAFQSLRSLDFTQMEVEMNGPLTGEIITRLKFDGVRQGQGASSNLVTRQIAKLPIQFRVNIRADFYSLLTNLQSMYDPAFVRDPRDLGLLESDGRRFTIPQAPEMPAIKPEDTDNPDNQDEPAIQPHESETMP